MRPCVLVINDCQPIFSLYADLLESDNYELELSTYEFEQPEMIELLKPTLLVLDFPVKQASRTRGWQLLDQLKLSRTLSSLPIILCTPALADVREQDHYLQDQGLVIFYKPFNLEHLVQKVQHMLALSLEEKV